MSENRIRTLLLQLREELSRNEQVDPETLQLVKKFDEEIDAFIESSEDVNSPVMDDAIALEARFAASHPTAEKLLRELIDSLGRIGI